MAKDTNKTAHEQMVDDKKDQPSDTYKKLPDTPANSGESISTANNTANGKYSKTDVRKEDKDFDTVRAGQ